MIPINHGGDTLAHNITYYKNAGKSVVVKLQLQSSIQACTSNFCRSDLSDGLSFSSPSRKFLPILTLAKVCTQKIEQIPTVDARILW
jgi:hypothetical protein